MGVFWNVDKCFAFSIMLENQSVVSEFATNSLAYHRFPTCGILKNIQDRINN